MSLQISKNALAFVEEAKEAFEDSPMLETYRKDDEYIALRMGADRDCINVFSLGFEIANFTQQLEPMPKPRKVVYDFAHLMEQQLDINERKGHWRKEHHEFLSRELAKNFGALSTALNKDDRDKEEITRRCANIANYVMMIADNEGDL